MVNTVFISVCNSVPHRERTFLVCEVSSRIGRAPFCPFLPLSRIGSGLFLSAKCRPASGGHLFAPFYPSPASGGHFLRLRGRLPHREGTFLPLFAPLPHREGIFFVCEVVSRIGRALFFAEKGSVPHWDEIILSREVVSRNGTRISASCRSTNFRSFRRTWRRVNKSGLRFSVFGRCGSG